MVYKSKPNRHVTKWKRGPTHHSNGQLDETAHGADEGPHVLASLLGVLAQVLGQQRSRYRWQAEAGVTSTLDSCRPRETGCPAHYHAETCTIYLLAWKAHMKGAAKPELEQFAKVTLPAAGSCA